MTLPFLCSQTSACSLCTFIPVHSCLEEFGTSQAALPVPISCSCVGEFGTSQAALTHCLCRNWSRV